MRYYILDESQPLGFIEVSKSEYDALFGDETIRPYVSKVYSGELIIDDVPEHLRASVRLVVDNRINRWGIYADQIRKVGTDEIYDEAIDIEDAPYTYEETGIPIYEGVEGETPEDYPDICG